MSLADNATLLRHLSTSDEQYLPVPSASRLPLPSSNRLKNDESATMLFGSGSGGGGGDLALLDSSSTTSIITESATENLENFGPLCRMRRPANASYNDYNVPKSYYNSYTCFKCAGYLMLDYDKPITPDPENATDLQYICDEFQYNPDQCARWTQCCLDAVACCDLQIENQRRNITDEPSSPQCPQVWDGFSCVGKTNPGQTVRIRCPNFVYPSNDPGPFEDYGTRTCDHSGEWAMYPDRGEYSFYQPCRDGPQEWDRDLNNFKIVCECISIATLATSIFCFVYCRQLRRQLPYRVHTQMFLAMFLYTVSCLLRETILHYFLTEESFPPGCEAITMLVRLFMVTAYSAMSVEAFYLHWNVACAFRPLTRLRMLFAVGWTFPIIVCGIYVALRVVFGGEDYNKECWLAPWGDFEFIIYGPNFACLALNLIFLISLFFITCRLQSVSRRRGCELLKRREFRAMITFTFLFGVPQVLVLVRPTSLTGIGFKIYEMTSVALQMLQGAFASVLLCFFNTEVRTVFLRTALGIILARERARYESIVSNLSNRVRHSMASFERRRSGRPKPSGARSSGDSAGSIELGPMLRSSTPSTNSRTTSVTYVSNHQSRHHHHIHQSHSQGLSLPVGVGSGSSTPRARDSVLATPEQAKKRTAAESNGNNGGYFFANNLEETNNNNNKAEASPLLTTGINAESVEPTPETPLPEANNTTVNIDKKEEEEEEEEAGTHPADESSKNDDEPNNESSDEISTGTTKNC